MFFEGSTGSTLIVSEPEEENAGEEETLSWHVRLNNDDILYKHAGMEPSHLHLEPFIRLQPLHKRVYQLNWAWTGPSLQTSQNGTAVM